jgi:hypothetical protein
MIIKRVHKDSLMMTDTFNRIFAWVKMNIGEAFDHMKYNHPDSVIIGVDHSFEDYKRVWQVMISEYQRITGETLEPKRLTWYHNKGWDVFKTVHYEAVPDSQFVSNVYTILVAIPDDILAVQLKLSVL